ncbi:MAG TPA: tRNA pseudouridine(38-40) synthase TruA [Exilispira sp.]|nr:tRNA pseudouridine(38-40) synthase TruA [Spirochaetota bacterium]NLJ05769.1 tRNA pseudouridine(38-40) synthase TruA [Exilispira sp.]HNV44020.1 tRNA pseudouridine(38-40) synthase TruA [Exilispira sp.]HQJ40176.1 tRNA pseudouridine(38-40) synthase TruA [Exilispira sp.]HQM90232.1 tRNA pseudouridine(38-40) synthase TruA [Exilispira sp.]
MEKSNNKIFEQDSSGLFSSELYYYRASIAYSGKEFYGFQVQENQRSVQQEIENVLLQINKKKKNQTDINSFVEKELFRIRYAGRTDRGVHAIENVISFALKKNFEPDKLEKIFNNILCPSIRLYNCKRADKSFNPRYAAIERVYLYLIYSGEKLKPFLKDLSFFYKDKIDIFKLNEALSIFQGEHDFSLFTTSLEKRNPIRKIYFAKAYNNDDFNHILISGKSFLHKQVRFIIGCCFSYLKGKISLNDIEAYLKPAARNKFKLEFSRNIEVFPPEGLYLYKVIFPDDKNEDIYSFSFQKSLF